MGQRPVGRDQRQDLAVPQVVRVQPQGRAVRARQRSVRHEHENCGGQRDVPLVRGRVLLRNPGQPRSARAQPGRAVPLARAGQAQGHGHDRDGQDGGGHRAQRRQAGGDAQQRQGAGGGALPRRRGVLEDRAGGKRAHAPHRHRGGPAAVGVRAVRALRARARDAGDRVSAGDPGAARAQDAVHRRVQSRDPHPRRDGGVRGGQGCARD